MGLDMYLRKNYYVQNWRHIPTEKKFTITIMQGNSPSKIPVDKIIYVQTEEIYWRKASAIHKWFVNNVQDGNDDCGKYYVGKCSLMELLNLVNEVLLDHSKAAELLPTYDGFFFGNSIYNDYYFQYLEYTKKELERVLAIEDDDCFEYHSSW